METIPNCPHWGSLVMDMTDRTRSSHTFLWQDSPRKQVLVRIKACKPFIYKQFGHLRLEDAGRYVYLRMANNNGRLQLFTMLEEVDIDKG